MGQRRPRQRSARERGADLRYNMEITLSEAYEGKTAQIRVPTSVTCEACTGSGAKTGTAPTTCRTCGGIGKVRAAQGFFTIERTCPSCHGRGEVIETPCPACNGSGRVTRERTLSVTIPAGVEDGTRIRLAGEARRDCAADLPATSTSSSPSSRMSSSSATAPTCSAACRSP
jgi:molecular chaperone DnaJ